MKKQFLTAVSLRLLFASVVLAPGATASATGVKSNDFMVRPVYKVDSLMAVQPEIRYIGYNEDYYYFEVQISNPSASKLDIVLTDKSTKNILYTDSFTDINYLKKVAIPRENVLLQWDVTNKSIKGKTGQRTYSLSTAVKIKEEVKVTRL
ncbi:hypothetical protein [Flavihumibacter fluvii]|uniref:hypothetical protein n=1 Tax=Flavihumibacter fluvii TaxID=2838157 RepID=UPI001BDE7A1A|nr:hypothetical protein [Flavihumibacter fluvii]ULQ52838.1 hypothetical protein KJS93_00695 [Flavihumibacter fluvii]